MPFEGACTETAFYDLSRMRFEAFDKAGEDIYYLTENKLHRCNSEEQGESIIRTPVAEVPCLPVRREFISDILIL